VVAPDRDVALARLAPAMQAFLTCDSWDEARKIIDGEPELLSSHGIGMIDDFYADQEQAGAGPDVLTLVRQHGNVLRTCRLLGLDIGMDQCVGDGSGVTDRHELYCALATLPRCDSWEEVERLLSDEPVLLDPGVDQILEELVTAEKVSEVLPGQALLDEIRRFLTAARRPGVVEAMERARAGDFLLYPIDMGPLTGALYNVLHARTGAELADLIATAPDLLSEDSDDGLARQIDAIIRSDSRFQAQLVRARFLLLRCREADAHLAVTEADAGIEGSLLPSLAKEDSLGPELVARLAGEADVDSRLACALAWTYAINDKKAVRALRDLRAAVVAHEPGTEPISADAIASERLVEGLAGNMTNEYPAELKAFVSASSWADASAILEQNQAQLLSPAVDELLARELDRMAGRDTVNEIAVYRHLLRRCREAGIAEAFEELSNAHAHVRELLVAADAAEQRFDVTRAPEDLDGLLEVRRAVVAAAPWTLGLDGEARGLAELAASLIERYWIQGDGADLAEAQELLQRSLSLPGVSEAQRLTSLSHLAIAGMERYSLDPRPEYLDQGIDAFEQVLASVHDPKGQGPHRLNLGTAYLDRFDLAGVADDLVRAVGELEQAVAALSPRTAYWMKAQHNLGTALISRYKLRGQEQDLEQAIAIFEEHITQLAAFPAIAAGTYSALGSSLQLRYARVGRVDDVFRAVTTHERAVDAEPEGPSAPTYLSNLGFALIDRYQATHAPGDLDAAVDAHTRAVERTPSGALAEGRHQNNLSVALMARYDRYHELKDLEAAIAARERAVQVTAPDSEAQPRHLDNLASALVARFRVTGDELDLSRAVELATDAAGRSDTSSVDSPRYFQTLASALRERWRLTPSTDDELRAVEAYRTSVQGTGAPNLAVQLASARAWGAFAVERSAWTDAAEAYDHALLAATSALGQQFTRGEKEIALQDLQGVASEAAYVYARSGRPEDAVEALENGQNLLLAASLSDDEARFAELDRLGRSDLAARYRDIRARIDVLDDARPGAHAVEEGLWRARTVAQARNELQAVSDEIRRITGLEQPPGMRFSDIGDLAGGIGLLYCATTSYGGVALLLTGATATPEAWFFDITYSQLRDLLIEPGAEGDSPRGFLHGILGDVGELQRSLTPLLDQLRSAIGQQLTSALVAHGLQSVTVIPTGVMNLLPIHAAVSPSQAAGMAVPSTLDIAYVPSARALRRARNVASQLTERPPAFVGVSDPTGSLMFAPLELVEAAKRFNDASSRLLPGEGVNKAAVLDAIERGATHVHFCCHGVFEPWDPAGSGLVLEEHARIRIDDLHRLPQEALARLLVASSCQTAITDFQRLPDEALGLPSALLEAGVGAVLAALWPVEDVAATVLISKFYSGLLGGDDGQSPMRPAAALQAAQTWLATATTTAVKALIAECLEGAASSALVDSERLQDAVTNRFIGYGDDESPFAEPLFWAPFILVGA
jgi:CHAT domain-containing protein/tetratricopeptide (TPR) repeat protein